MALQEFPSFMELILDGYQESRQPMVYRTEFENGPVKQRPSTCRTMKTRSFTYVLCGKNTYVEWEQFWHEIGQGSYYFLWCDPVDEQSKRARIVGGGYTAKPLNKDLSNWEISLEIESWV